MEGSPFATEECDHYVERPDVSDACETSETFVISSSGGSTGGSEEVTLLPGESEGPQVIGNVTEGPGEQVDARELTPFSIGTDILRGVRSTTVLRRCASLLRNAEGSADTFDLSHSVDYLDAFISHNWSVSRVKKWMALSLHYNLTAAAIGALLTAAILGMMTMLGFLPLSASDVETNNVEGVYCRVCGSLVFVTLLLFGADILPRHCIWHSEVFLDKACINQVSEELQREGIESLGGFLFYFWTLVVLYTRVYTQKVWTVYEMACFLLLNPEGHLVWLPLNLPPAILLGTAVSLLADLASWTLRQRSVMTVVAIPYFLVPVAYIPSLFVFHIGLRKVSREQAQSRADLRNFSIKDAVCAVERDRITVEDNVVSVMKLLEHVQPDCTREEALAAFDLLVRSKMPQLIRSSSGTAGLRYEYALTLLFPLVLYIFDVVSAQVVGGAGTQQLLAVIIELVARIFASLPLAFAWSAWLSGQCEDLHGMREILFLVFTTAVHFLLGYVLYLMLRILRAYAAEDDICFVLLCVIAIGLFTLTVFLFRRPTGKGHRRRMRTAAKSAKEVRRSPALLRRRAVTASVNEKHLDRWKNTHVSSE